MLGVLLFRGDACARHRISAAIEDLDGGQVSFLTVICIGCACDIPSHAYTFPFALNVSTPIGVSGL